jgi:hypothetical protein
MKKTRTFRRSIAAVFCGAGLLFAASASLYFLGKPGVRRVFFFPSRTGGLYTETRSLARQTGGAAVVRYVEELLLGPTGTHAVPLFSPGARVVSCFLRDKTLYIDLSGEALFAEKDACPVKEGAALLKKNCLRNFRAVSEVKLYINGTGAYEDFE